MKPLEECLKHINKIHYPPKVAERILLRNQAVKEVFVFGNFRFLSYVQLYRQHTKFQKNPDIPLWDGDEVIYLTDNDKEPLAACSIKLGKDYFFVNSMQGIKGRKTKRKKLKGSAYNIIRYGNWERAFLDIVEKNAEWCETDFVKVASSSCFPDSTKMFLRYDVPCIYRGYQRKGDFWIKKTR